MPGSLPNLACPAIAGMGAVLMQDGDRFVYRQPFARQVTTVDGRRCARQAVTALVDHGLAATIRQKVESSMMTTIDYRIDWIAPLPDHHGFDVVSSVCHVLGDTAIANVDVRSTGAADVSATATGRFRLGVLPGGAVPTAAAEWVSPDVSSTGSFADLLGLIAPRPNFDLPPLERLIGATQLPAFHGGMIASAMNFAATSVLSGRGSVAMTESYQYLRPTLADRPAAISARPVRIGRTIAWVDADTTQDGWTCARATFVFALPLP